MSKNYSIMLLTLLMGTAALSPPTTLPQPQTKFTQASIGTRTYRLEIADTMAKRGRGLSGRKSLDRDQGMLFVLQRPGTYVFCMENMNFPLDFIWLREDRVVGLTENVPVNAEEVTIREKFDKVIELSAGAIKESGLKLGNSIRFSPVAK